MKRQHRIRTDDEFINPVDESELDDPALAPLRELMLDLAHAREAGEPPPADPNPIKYRDGEAHNLRPEFRG